MQTVEGITTFADDFDWIEHMNDMGTLSPEAICGVRQDVSNVPAEDEVGSPDLAPDPAPLPEPVIVETNRKKGEHHAVLLDLVSGATGNTTQLTEQNQD